MSIQRSHQILNIFEGLVIKQHYLRVLTGFTALVLVSCAGVPAGSIASLEGLTYRSGDDAYYPGTAIRLTAVGDIMMDGTAKPYMTETGYDAAFDGVRTQLSNTSVLVGNLEGPLTHHAKIMVEKKYTFRSPPDLVAGALARAGFNAVSLANNHSLDFGVQGMRDTILALQRYNIAHFGAGENINEARKPVIIDVQGVKLGLLGYSNTFPEEFWAGSENPGTAFGHAEHLAEDIRKLKSQVDFVAINIHWGQEGTTKLRDYQPYLAYLAIDAGADLVIGHHPHVLQAVEEYKNGLILYSLGNFVFGSFSPRAKLAAIAQIDFIPGMTPKLSLLPINVNNFEIYFQPQLLDQEAGAQLFSHMNNISKLRNTQLRWVDNKIQLMPKYSVSLPIKP